LILEPGTDKLWVANTKSHSLSMLRLEQTVASQRVPVHANPIRLSVSPQNSTLYVLCTGRDAYPAASVVQMVDLPNQKAGLTYSVGEDARDFSLGSMGKYLYSISPQGLKIYNLLTDASLVIPTGKNPRSLAVSPDGSQVYVACRDENAVYVHTIDKAFR
jgi:DNA-binding beta-propeller fold protein YncE